MVAAIWIRVEAIENWLAGLPLEHLGSGAVLLLAAGLLNAWSGWYLLRVGKRSHSILLEADGKHVLTDSFTSFGLVAGLGLVTLTGWRPFDPLIAIAVAQKILWSGGRLAWRALRWDCSTTPIQRSENSFAESWTPSATNWVCTTTACVTAPPDTVIEEHLLFPHATVVDEAHRLATLLEERLPVELGTHAEVITHSSRWTTTKTCIRQGTTRDGQGSDC